MKFNKPTRKKTQTRNYEGGKAFKLSPELDLYSSVVTSSLCDKFYEKAEDRVGRIRSLIQIVKPEFVTKLAVYAREKMYLRSIPLVLAVELAKIHRGDNLISKLVGRVIQRADEIMELLAYYQQANERTEMKKLNKLSKQIKKGLVAALNKFDTHQFGKYNRDTEVTFKDVIFLVHPKAKNPEQQEIFNKIINGTLEAPYTWEVELSKLGQEKFETEDEKKKAFKAKWEELIDSEKIGYMALIRNLRNILQAEVSLEHLKKVLTKLSDRDEVLKSKQFPFRFLSAYRQIKEESYVQSSIILEALEKAIQVSAENIKGFDENISVLIACDMSGSMQHPISPKSVIENYEVGLTLGMLLKSRCKLAMIGIFGEYYKIINLPATNILANTDYLDDKIGEVGHSTNGYLAIDDLIKRKQIIDKVFMFTDCQLWDSTGYDNQLCDSWSEYKKIAPDAKLYLFDLAGYGDTPISVLRPDVFFIAGWSDKVFEILEAIENGSTAIKEIEKIAL